MSLGKFGPTASNFGYDFEAENGLLRGSELGPKIITHNYDIGKIYPAKSILFFSHFVAHHNIYIRFRVTALRVKKSVFH